MFEQAPVAAARCNSRGEIVEMNPAFERLLRRNVGGAGGVRWFELVGAEDRIQAEKLLRELMNSQRDSISMQTQSGARQVRTTWTAWRRQSVGELDHAVLMAEETDDIVPEGSLIQAQRWEAVGRLAGGVVHDFNNLLTGVMLYCDLLLSSLDGRDRRRRYADEVRAAIVQAASLVQQLLVFARPQAAQAGSLNLNEIAGAMRDLLTRLIGENIVLEMRLDPDLALVKVDPAQAQQILLNLVLNARDALPDGGRITVETSNCKFQPVAGAPITMARSAATVFPCVLLVVSDNGCGMDAKTRERLFEPFFTTKSSGKGTGLGLTTVRSIVGTNRGLIHVESELGRGTRAMIMLPRALSSIHARASGPEPQDAADRGSSGTATTPFQEIKKESL